MRKAILSLVILLSCAACSDDMTSTYSQKYKVMCGFLVVEYPDLQMVMGNYGQFATIRQSGNKIITARLVRDEASGGAVLHATERNMDALSKDFRFGLGGLIVGTDYFGNNRAFDLACPNCDRNSRRLTLRDDGTVRCSHCAMVYDLQNDGAIVDTGDGLYDRPRGLYRYPITFDGSRVTIVN